MATEYVKRPFLSAGGKVLDVGDKAPEESDANLKRYRAMGLIGEEAEVEKTTGIDVGRPGKVATRKQPAAKTAK